MSSGDVVQQIKEKLDIVDVISLYVQLQAAGKNLKGKSPFTNEKTPSFYVSPDRGMYYCFSTSQGGDIFTFIQKMEGVDFKGALRLLAEQAGVELVAEDPAKKSARDRQYDILETTTAYWQEQLHTQSAAQQYLQDRGVQPSTIGSWRIGYAPGPPHGGWRDTKQSLVDTGYTETELATVGLIKNTESGKESYDTFRDRIIFPIADPAGRIVGFSGRSLTPNDKAPKYVNSPDTDLFNKSEILYGYDKAKTGIRTYDFSLIVEGQFDVVMSHQAGYTNTVAVSGTALTSHHAALLQRLSNRVVLALDADKAGIAAAKRASERMLPRGMDVKIAGLPEGLDPADLILEDGQKFKKYIATAKHIVEYLLQLLRTQHAEERAYKLAVHQEVLPFISLIPNQIDREHFIGVVANTLQISKKAILSEVERLEKEAQATQSTARSHVVADDTATPPESATTSNAQYEYLQAQLYTYHSILATKAQKTLAEWYQEVTGLELVQASDILPATVLSEVQFVLEEQIQKIPKTQLLADVAHTMTVFAKVYYKQALRTLKEQLQSADTTDSKSIDTIHTSIAMMHKQIGQLDYKAEDLDDR